MTKDSVITDAVRNAIGMEFGPYVYEVEKGAIKRVAQAIEDPNPKWQDEEYARKARQGSIIASPTFLFTLRFDEVTRAIKELDCPLDDELNGGSEIEYFQPIRPGDVISVRARISEVTERQGRKGKLLFFLVDLTYQNQNSELVAKHWFTFIRH